MPDVAPATGVTEPLCLEQIGLAPSKPVLGFPAGMDVGEQVVPPDDTTVGISQREATRLKPPVLAIKPPDSVLEFVRLSRFDGVLPGSEREWKIGGMNGVRGAPLLEFVEGPAEIFEYPAVDVLDRARRRHHGDEAGNRLDNEAKALLAHTSF